MGILPFTFVPQWSESLGNYDINDEMFYHYRDVFYKDLRTAYPVEIYLIRNHDKGTKIDNWIRDNVKGMSWFTQEYSDRYNDWVQIWSFENKDEAVLFKIIWCGEEK